MALSTGLWIAAITAILDQASKLYLLFGLGMTTADRFAVLPFANIVMTFNPGISYGLLAMEGRQGQLILAGIAAAISLFLIIWLWRGEHTKLGSLSVGLILGGAVGNAIDRLHLPGVADFVQLHAAGYSWYIFNIADVAIVAGVIGLLYDTLTASRDDAAKPS